MLLGQVPEGSHHLFIEGHKRIDTLPNEHYSKHDGDDGGSHQASAVKAPEQVKRRGQGHAQNGWQQYAHPVE